MLIEISNVGFVNKGSELMLHAALQKMKNVYPNAHFVVAPSFKDPAYLKRAELQLWQKPWLWYCGIQWGDFARLLPIKIRYMFGIVLDRELDIVLNAAGFAYTDQTGIKGTKKLARASKRWKKRGTKLILLPQAFGPFRSFKIQKYIKIIADNAELIFTRDPESYKYLTEVVGERQNIKIAPDFTNLVRSETPKNFDTQANRFCIIPNYRMIERTDKKISANYILFLLNCVKYLLEYDAKPFILIHEENDFWLGQQVANKLDHGINIVRETSPLHIKGIIGASDGVISSRFHGLVSALSQGVPALATGWSHKYEMLFQDYDFPEGILEVDTAPKEIQAKINLILLEESKQQIKYKILNASKEQIRFSSNMWDEVLTLLSQK